MILSRCKAKVTIAASRKVLPCQLASAPQRSATKTLLGIHSLRACDLGISHLANQRLRKLAYIMLLRRLRSCQPANNPPLTGAFDIPITHQRRQHLLMPQILTPGFQILGGPTNRLAKSNEGVPENNVPFLSLGYVTGQSSSPPTRILPCNAWRTNCLAPLSFASTNCRICPVTSSALFNLVAASIARS